MADVNVIRLRPITAPKATDVEAKLIRERLQGALTRYDVPMEPAFATEDWSVNR
jgi:hypothetical protein